jgi:hypothetical protein
MGDINAQIEQQLSLANVHFARLKQCIAKIKELKASIGNLGEAASKATAAVNNMIAELPKQEGNIRRAWGAGDYDYLKANGHKSNIELAAHFNVTPHAISTAFNRIRNKDKNYKRPEIGTPRKERVKPVVITTPDAIASLTQSKTIVSKPNATKWNESNGKLHEVKKGTRIYGPPLGHPELTEWLTRMQVKFGGVKVAQAEDEKYLIENEWR